MKQHCRWLILSMACLLLLGACKGGDSKKGQLQLYFAPIELKGGASLMSETSDLQCETATVSEAMEALLAGPRSEHLNRLIPSGVELLDYAEKSGCVTVNLSERYGGLSDVRLTIANYSIVLTLCQLPDVECVRIAVDGVPVTEEALRPNDLMQSGGPAALEED